MILTGEQIVGAPGFFPTVWGWIKRWFDPGTTSKIFILSAAEVQPTLTSFMDPASIPKQYGGELEWQWGDMPNLDESASELLKDVQVQEGDKKSLLKGPVLFKGDQIEVVGTENGKARRNTIPVPKTEQQKPISEATEPADKPTESASDADSTPVPTENEKVAVNIDQVAAEEAQTTTAAA